MAFGLTVCLMAPACRTNRVAEAAVGESPASSAAANATIRKLNEIVIPEMTFFAPATIVDAVDFLKQASREYDKSGAPPEKRGVSFVVNLPPVSLPSDREGVDPFAEVAVTNRVAPMLPAMSVRNVSLFDALQLVCEVTDMRLRILEDGSIVLTPKAMWGDEDWATCSYSIPSALTDHLFNNHAGRASDADPNKVWQTFFDQLGVTKPDFAKVDYLPAIGKLRVTNTPENLAIIEVAFETFALHLVEAELQIHAFRAADIERLRLSGCMSVESLMDLRSKGKARSVAAATALTKSGQEAVVKAVQEVIYPTELNAGGALAGTNVTSRNAANALMPGNFEMRETGMILQVVPEVRQWDALINLILNPQWITLEGWESYSANLAAGWTHKTPTLKQPVFGVTSFQTQVAVEDGGTVLLGSCSTPDGEWVQFGFLTARLRDGKPPSSGRRTAKPKPQNEQACSSVAQKMREIVIPEMAFRPPSTIIDAVKFFKEASVRYDKPGVPEAQRGVGFVLKLPTNGGERAEGGTNSVAPVISALSARFINLYDALKLVCDVTGMTFGIRNGIVWIQPLGVDPDDELITRCYPVLSCMYERMSGADGNRAKEGQAWKDFIAQLGLNWPEGASASYVASDGVLRVTNTRENLEVFEQVLADLSILPRMIEVTMQIQAYKSEDIEKVRLSGELSMESLMALRKKGKSKPVASASVITKSGQESVMKSVREVLFPTELGSDGRPGALMPSNFEMREVGMLLQVVPEINVEDQSKINLILNPQWITLDRWETYPADLAAGWTHKTLAFRQPVFGVTSFQSQISVADGQTVLLGNSSTPDGKWVHVGFLTAKRVDVQSGLSKRQP